MTSRQIKIEKNRSKRAKRLASKQARAHRQAMSQMFPKIVYKNDGAATWFFDAVQQAMQQIVGNHPRLLGKGMTKFMRDAKDVGFPCLLHKIARADRRPITESLTVMRVWLLLGELIRCRLQDATGDSFFPSQDFDVHLGKPRANMILISCRALMDVKTRGGTAYFSPGEPTVRIDGKEWNVAFYRHAIERICDRAVDYWTTYAGWGDVFAFLYKCVYFEPYRMSRKQMGFSLFQDCSPTYFSYAYAEQVLGRLDPKKTYYYRVGYCPVIQDGAFIVAKTLLIPGMRGTPEHAIIREMSCDFDQRLKLEQRVNQQTLHGLAESADFSLIRKSHEAGMPQVVSLDQEVFRTRNIDKIDLR